MEDKLLKELQKKLEAEKILLEKDLSKFADKDKKISYDYDTRFPELDVATRPLASDENAAEIESYANLLAIEHALELRLKEVEEALEKIKKNDGSYGKCEQCHKEIELERLKANPAAKICLKCANQKNN
ncbi:MAG: DksA C4-type protein [Patescibacteria group bacterium]|nr:DksA C4-type protein [Patescibacteria group bacterium]